MSYPIILHTIPNDVAEDIDNELRRASKHGTTFPSLHEAYSVILEELDEVWDITKQKKKDRSKIEIHDELIQIAAMAIKAIQSIDNYVGGDV